MSSPLPDSLVQALTPTEELPPWKDPLDSPLWSRLTNAEATAMSGVPGPSQWSDVLRISLDLLAECGWDTRLVQQATKALLHRHGSVGWLFGMRLWEELLRARWELLGPARPAVRAGAALRYATAMEGWLLDERTRPKPSGPLREESRALLAALKRAYGARGLDREGLLERATDVLDDWPAPPPEQPEQPEQPEPIAEAPSAATPAPPHPPTEERVAQSTVAASGAQSTAQPQSAQRQPVLQRTVQPSVDVERSVNAAPADSSPAQIRDHFDAQRKGVFTLLEQVRLLDPGAPFPYRIAREWAWAHAKVPSLADPARARLGFGLPQQVRLRELTDGLAARDWSATLLAAERSWVHAVFWLDPHHASAQALRALGHSGAALAIEQVVTSLVNRLPNLEKLEYHDGRPLASDETRAWLDHLRAQDQARPADSSVLPPRAALPVSPAAQSFQLSAASATEPTVGRALLQPAEVHADQGNPERTLEQLMLLLSQTIVPRDRFRLKLEFADLLLRGGLGGPARLVLEELEACAQAMHLDQWEPPLVVELVRLQMTLSRSETPARPDALPKLQQRAAQLGALHLLIQ